MAKPTKVGEKWRVQFRRKGQSSISRYFDKKTHAEAYARKIDQEIRAGEFASSKEFANTTVEDILVRYETEVSKTKEMGISKKHCLKTHTAHLGSTLVSKLTSESIIDYANMRQSIGTGGVTVNMELTYLKGALKIAQLVCKISIKAEVTRVDQTLAKRYLNLPAEDRLFARNQWLRIFNRLRVISFMLASIRPNLASRNSSFPRGY